MVQGNPDPASALRLVERLLGLVGNVISGVCFAGMFLVVLAAIVMRFLLKIPFFWGEEAARYFMLTGIFFGMAIAVRDKAHLGVDVFVNLLPERAAKAVRLAALAVTTVMYAIITKICWDFSARMARGSQTSPAMSIPMWIIYGIIFVGFFLCTVESLLQVIVTLTGHEVSATAAGASQEEEVHLL